MPEMLALVLGSRRLCNSTMYVLPTSLLTRLYKIWLQILV